jgi:hypothetical protein
VDIDKCINHLEQMGFKIGLKNFTEPQKKVLLEISEIIEAKMERSLDKLEKVLNE